MALSFDLRKIASFMALLVGFFLTAAYAAPLVERYVRLHKVLIPAAFFNITDPRHLVVVGAMTVGMIITYYTRTVTKRKLSWVVSMFWGISAISCFYIIGECIVAPDHFRPKTYWDGLFWGTVIMAGFCASVAVAAGELVTTTKSQKKWQLCFNPVSEFVPNYIKKVVDGTGYQMALLFILVMALSITMGKDIYNLSIQLWQTSPLPGWDMIEKSAQFSLLIVGLCLFGYVSGLLVLSVLHIFRIKGWVVPVGSLVLVGVFLWVSIGWFALLVALPACLEGDEEKKKLWIRFLKTD